MTYELVSKNFIEKEPLQVSITAELTYCPKCRKQIHLKSFTGKHDRTVYYCPQCHMVRNSGQWKEFLRKRHVIQW